MMVSTGALQTGYLSASHTDIALLSIGNSEEKRLEGKKDLECRAPSFNRALLVSKARKENKRGNGRPQRNTGVTVL